MNNPDIKILAISNIYSRLMHFKLAGDYEQGHYHTYDHGTLLSSGKLLVEIIDDSGKTVESKEFVAPTFVYIDKNRIHKLTALEDNTVAVCIHALRTIDEDILSPDFLVEVKEFADTPTEHTVDKPVIGYFLAKEGITYKPIAY